jgi:hypothetical protein
MNTTHLAALAGIHELLHPLFARRSIGASRRDEVVAMVLEPVEILPPEGHSISGRHVRLSRLVGPKRKILSGQGKLIGFAYHSLIGTHSAFGIAGLDKIGKVTCLFRAPQHRTALHAKVVGVVNTPGAPSVVPWKDSAEVSPEHVKTGLLGNLP